MYMASVPDRPRIPEPPDSATTFTDPDSYAGEAALDAWPAELPRRPPFEAPLDRERLAPEPDAGA
jgi:hypothetical protein